MGHLLSLDGDARTSHCENALADFRKTFTEHGCASILPEVNNKLAHLSRGKSCAVHPLKVHDLLKEFSAEVYESDCQP